MKGEPKAPAKSFRTGYDFWQFANGRHLMVATLPDGRPDVNDPRIAQEYQRELADLHRKAMGHIRDGR